MTFTIFFQSIAISLQEPIYKRSESRGSIASMISVDADHLSTMADHQSRARAGSKCFTLL